ncbi:MAG: hypothetical protein ACKOXB_08755 [Flavobacteriales bacterium]
MVIDFLQEKEIFTPFLQKGERLLWIGVPRKGIVFSRFDFFLIPFSIIWFGFSLFWETLALWGLSESDEVLAWIFPVVGLPFVLFGYFLCIGRFTAAARRRKKTIYAFSDQRVFIKIGDVAPGFLYLKEVPGVELKGKNDGSGSIRLTPMNDFFADLKDEKKFETYMKAAGFAFEEIPEARKVQEQLSKLVEQAKENDKQTRYTNPDRY